jgi:2,4-dienoyl-CoA reductase-like NADH-dependent reductase (Old Yellow Enzyme family)
MTTLFEPLAFAHGRPMKNRFMLAPLTNKQSHADGTLSEDEYRWLTLRAEGGFGSTMTCALHVERRGQGFSGQLGAFSDAHIPGLARLAEGIKAGGGLALGQLYHAGMRADAGLIGEAPVSSSDNAEFGARALHGDEIEQITEDFIVAAERLDRAGFDGLEFHGAHGYLLGQFLSPELNRRDDRWGGSLENRTRIYRDVLAGARARCRPDFNLGLRISPERFGMRLAECREFAAELMGTGLVDFLVMSLWDVFKEPIEPAFQGASLLSWFADLPRGQARLGAAGKITSGPAARRAMEAGLDFVVVGRAAIVHPDFPDRIAADPQFSQMALPVTPEYLRSQGVAPPFIGYLSTMQNFVVGGAGALALP